MFNPIRDRIMLRVSKMIADAEKEFAQLKTELKKKCKEDIEEGQNKIISRITKNLL
jgi:vacuolar-type H+-ATPase subunit H